MRNIPAPSTYLPAELNEKWGKMDFFEIFENFRLSYIYYPKDLLDGMNKLNKFLDLANGKYTGDPLVTP